MVPQLLRIPIAKIRFLMLALITLNAGLSGRTQPSESEVRTVALEPTVGRQK